MTVHPTPAGDPFREVADQAVTAGRRATDVLGEHLRGGGPFDSDVVAWAIERGVSPPTLGELAKHAGVLQASVLEASKDLGASRVPLVRAYLQALPEPLAESANDVALLVARLRESAKGPPEFRAVDVTTLADRPERPQIIEGLWPRHSFIGIVAEEGYGKTVLAEQICRQILRCDRVLDFFDLGLARSKKILFIDTEMEEDDAKDRDDEARARGLEVEPDQLYWFSSGGLNLDDEGDVRVVSRELERVQPDLVWIDSGVNAVSESEEGRRVQKFFNQLSGLMRQFDLLGVGLTLHPRKRAQGAGDRRFDDLFGSREWKGRLNTVLYLEGNRVIAWKNRGGRLAKLWQTEPGRRPHAALNRPGLSDPAAVPFTVSLPEEPSEGRQEALEGKIRGLLSEHPSEFTKTALAQAAGGRKTDALHIIEHLQGEGTVVPAESGAKLRLVEGTPPATDGDPSTT